MNLKNIISGINIPNDIYVIIEIPLHSHSVKYEIDKKSEILFVDRFILTPMLYPCNYGYINQTISKDGDPLDVLIPIPYRLEPKCVIQCKPIGILKMVDESGEDAKIIAIPNEQIYPESKNILDIQDLSNHIKNQIVHFFKHYKDLEKNKWVKIIGFEDSKSAKKEINLSINRFKKK
ncbi:inorganic diphosphatase [Buchnera aphidicola]|uniref:inorganic diphosphatase n=1 Tax=Buchnera aphidicola TaxID=9 RepID=UPI00346448D9